METVIMIARFHKKKPFHFEAQFSKIRDKVKFQMSLLVIERLAKRLNSTFLK